MDRVVDGDRRHGERSLKEVWELIPGSQKSGHVKDLRT
jgi:hypothetical protein